jgi:hypothetical protein
VKIEKKSMDLDQYLNGLDFNNLLAKDIIFSDLDDDEEERGQTFKYEA